MRKMASIKEIISISPIPDSDNIDLARIDGWQSVVKKGQFQAGEKVIFCEPDSLLPEKPEFEFMRSKHFKIKTCKLRGVISQGICFPLDMLPTGSYDVDQDVSEILGITKYEPPVPVQLRGRMRCPIFRLAVPKTDEMRVQNIPDVLERHKGEVFNVTEKIDGCVHKDTIISLPVGNMTIEELFNIKYKGKIISFDLFNNQLVIDNVVNITKRKSSKKWLLLKLENGTNLKITSDHMVYVPVLGTYKKASELRINDGVMIE